jgi:hypothetical protein
VSDALDATARLYDEAANELGRALRHCRVAAQHFRDELVPRGAAHAWAARGHVLRAEQLLDAQAREHAAKSSLPGD